MRNLFLVLVLANLAFAAYHGWFAPAPAANRSGAANTPDLVLASEVESAAAARDVGAPDDAGAGGEAAAERLAAVPPTTRCISVGPFRELSQAATAAANLRAGGLDPSQRAGEGEIWVGYWVYLEQIPSVAAAEEILDVLRENGITDSYVIPRSDSGTLISLGVFTEINRARNRREAVRELGYDATISDRTRRATVYWIEVDLAEGQLLDFEQLQPPGRIVRLEQRACEDAPL